MRPEERPVIEAGGMLLTVFLSQYAESPAHQFLEAFPHPFLVEMRRTAPGEPTNPFQRGGEATEMNAMARPSNATRPDPQSLILTVEKRSDEFAGHVALGRAGTSDVVIAQGDISKVHAVFRTHTNNTVTILDTGSRNGTFVNQQKLLAEAERTLRSGDRVQFSEAAYRFFYPADLHRELPHLLEGR